MVTPSTSSSLRMATDSVGWLTKQASAARPKWRSLATATTYFNSVKVIALLSCVNNPDAATSTVLHALAPPRDSVSANIVPTFGRDAARCHRVVSRQNAIRLAPLAAFPEIRPGPEFPDPVGQS